MGVGVGVDVDEGAGTGAESIGDGASQELGPGEEARGCNEGEASGAKSELGTELSEIGLEESSELGIGTGSELKSGAGISAVEVPEIGEASGMISDGAGSEAKAGVEASGTGVGAKEEDGESDEASLGEDE